MMIKTMALAFLILNLLSAVASGEEAAPSASTNPDKSEREKALELAAKDSQRPIFHAIAPAFMMGDPNGLIQFKGTYHMFYQTSVTYAENPRMHWGHLRSKDLLHWESLPMALTPDKYYHICSGSAVNDNGQAVAIFTGAEPQQQCIAMSLDEELIRWEQYKGNPVIAGPPDNLKTVGFRDPYVWREGDDWIMAVGSGIEGLGGTLFAYQSKDLKTWESIGTLIEPSRENLADMCECPSLLDLGGKHMLTCNALPLPVDWAKMKSVYFLGKYENRKFTPEIRKDLDLFGEVWAPQAFKDESGRQILFVFAWEARDGKEHGWHGCMSLPREVSLGADGAARFAPIAEMKGLRHDPLHFEAIPVSPETRKALGDAKGDPAEIIAVFEPDADGGFSAERFGLILRQSPGQEEQTRIVVDTKNSRVFVDRTRASLDPKVGGGSREDRGQIEIRKNEPLTLHVFVDRSALDVFVDDRAAGTTRIYPTRPDSLGMDLFAEGGSVKAKSVDIWQLKNN